MTKQKQQELIDSIQTMGARQLESLKRSISVSDANSYVKDKLKEAVDERESRLNRIDSAIVEECEMVSGEIEQ